MSENDHELFQVRGLIKNGRMFRIQDQNRTRLHARA